MMMLDPVEVSETYIGGKERNKHKHRKLGRRWRDGRTEVVAGKDRDSNQVAAAGYHKLSAKHLQRYVSEFADRHDMRERDTIRQIEHIVLGMVGRPLV